PCLLHKCCMRQESWRRALRWKPAFLHLTGNSLLSKLVRIKAGLWKSTEPMLVTTIWYLNMDSRVHQSMAGLCNHSKAAVSANLRSRIPSAFLQVVCEVMKAYAEPQIRVRLGHGKVCQSLPLSTTGQQRKHGSSSMIEDLIVRQD